MKTKTAWLGQWIESEAGWGQKDDGVSFHDTKENALKWGKTNAGGSYGCYWRMESPREVEVSQEFFNQIVQKGGTLSLGQNEYRKKFKKVLVAR